MINIETVPRQYRTAVSSLVSFANKNCSLHDTEGELERACSISPFKAQAVVKATITYSIMVDILDLMRKKHGSKFYTKINSKLDTLSELLKQELI